MADNTIEIEVELKGQKETLKGLDEVKDGAEGIGETFKGVSDIVGKTNERLGESLGSLSDAVSEGASAFEGLRDAAVQIGEGSASISTLLGPLALLVTAVGAAYEAYRQFSGAAQEAEERQEALAAAAADLTSKLEELAEKGFVPATQQLQAYIRANIEAQVAKEMLETATSKASKSIYADMDATEAATKAAKEYAQALKEHGRGSQAARFAQERMNEALTSAQTQGRKTDKVFEELTERTSKVHQQVSQVAESFKKMEEQTKETLAAKAKEQANQMATILALKAEAEALDEVSLLERKRAAERTKKVQLDFIENASREQLADLVESQKRSIESLNEEAAKDAILSKKIAELQSKKANARDKDTKAIKSQADALKQLEAQQRQRLVEESSLRQLQIKLTQQGFDQQLSLARERYETGLQLAKDDATKRAIVEANYELEKRRIKDAEFQVDLTRLAKVEEAEKKAAEKARELAFSTAEFNAQFIQDETERELAQIKVKYDRELELAENNEALKTELMRRYGMERMRVEQKASQALMEQARSVISDYGKGFAEAAVGAALFGESFQDSIANVLNALAREAGVKAIMETAYGTAALLLNPAQASAHFAAAGIFASAAGLARAGGAALGGGGGGGGGSTSASPSGAPLSAPAPQREQASTEEMVFNINFGGAVIYDTRRAAEQALTDRVIETLNRPRRGAVRMNSRG